MSRMLLVLTTVYETLSCFYLFFLARARFILLLTVWSKSKFIISGLEPGMD